MVSLVDGMDIIVSEVVSPIVDGVDIVVSGVVSLPVDSADVVVSGVDCTPGNSVDIIVSGVVSPPVDGADVCVTGVVSTPGNSVNAVVCGVVSVVDGVDIIVSGVVCPSVDGVISEMVLPKVDGKDTVAPGVVFASVDGVDILVSGVVSAPVDGVDIITSSEVALSEEDDSISGVVPAAVDPIFTGVDSVDVDTVVSRAFSSVNANVSVCSLFGRDGVCSASVVEVVVWSDTASVVMVVSPERSDAPSTEVAASLVYFNGCAVVLVSTSSV